MVAWAMNRDVLPEHALVKPMDALSLFSPLVHLAESLPAHSFMSVPHFSFGRLNAGPMECATVRVFFVEHRLILIGRPKSVMNRRCPFGCTPRRPRRSDDVLVVERVGAGGAAEMMLPLKSLSFTCRHILLRFVTKAESASRSGVNHWPLYTRSANSSAIFCL
jgi:hypothetical protein